MAVARILLICEMKHIKAEREPECHEVGRNPSRGSFPGAVLKGRMCDELFGWKVERILRGQSQSCLLRRRRDRRLYGRWRFTCLAQHVRAYARSGLPGSNLQASHRAGGGRPNDANARVQRRAHTHCLPLARLRIRPENGHASRQHASPTTQS